MPVRAYLVVTQAAPPRELRLEIQRLGGHVALALPAALVVLAPEGGGDALAALPGVRHAGEVTLPAASVPRLRLGPDGRWRPVG